MFEHRHARLLPREQFIHRLLRSIALASGLIIFSLGIGVLGYHIFAEFSWIDSLYNASMILTGMGPADRISSVEGKLFASIYALFSGIVFLGGVALVFAPLFHRFLHRFHFEAEDRK